MKMVEIVMPTNLHIKPTLTFNPSASISTWHLRKKPRGTKTRKLGAVFASISTSSHDTIGEELWPRSELCGNNKEKRASKKRVFFLDVNPLCYAGSTPSLHSFAHWISLFFSQVSLTDPVIAVLDGEGGSEHRRLLLPSYKAHRRKFSRKSSAPQKYPSERSHVVTDILTKCNVPVGEPWLTVSSILYLKLPTFRL
ncbi:5'-3' EXONUCLEASE FAMILY PROTEIN [Salix koriyanagi]|uniref:5'-3' EXONUCLEASE FAMILY PROTEIN n=1 Tax=Salix koriyanagi TaxID=2511006 RepID=A0A9Q0W2N9_9ROSI|nr:5'-3' EXONUCLEASE FAMILY PROTEIN [Salix koriyanagi]KAJ6757948.1 5'-3' EXONUCLEASE FAMILY PROTEIN [Salix koriyanagi]